MVWLTIFLLFVTTENVAAETSIGLSPNFEDRAVGEARTASARGTAALFYNPAALTQSSWHFSLVDVQQTMDDGWRSASKKYPGSQNGEDGLTTILDALDTGKPFATATDVSVLSVSMPYLATNIFSGLHSQVIKTKSEDGDDVLGLSTGADAGAIAGLGIQIGKLSLGYSRYLLVTSSIEAHASSTYIADTRGKLDSGILTPATVPYRDFVNAAYGQGLGQNVGMLYQPFLDQNPSGIGVSVLNVGQTRFDKKWITSPQFKQQEERLQELSDQYEIPLEKPDALPQMVNTGITVGWGGGSSDDVTFLTSFDMDDIGGNTIKHKFAAGSELDLELPDSVAKLLTMRYEHKGYKYQLGLMGTHFAAGIRPGDNAAVNYGLTLHGGLNNVSFLKITLQGFQEVLLDEGGRRLDGIGAELALTLLL